MKNSPRIIVIGSIFLLCGVSLFGIISLEGEGMLSGFWNMSQATTTYADNATGTLTRHIAPNGKVYTIRQLSAGTYVFERADGTVSSRKFTSYQSAVNFIHDNNQRLQEAGTYTAPNGKKYTIVHNVTSQAYAFRRPDGSMSSGYFPTKQTLVSYITKNNSRVATPLVPSTAKPVAGIATNAITPAWTSQEITPVTRSVETPQPTPAAPVTIDPTVNTVATPTVTTPPPVAVKNTKTQEVSYRAPSGNESMTVSVTTKDGVITEVSVTPLARGTSLMYQQAFAGDVSGSVVGKAIKGLKVDTISGASLTTAAFNDFLASNTN